LKKKKAYMPIEASIPNDSDVAQLYNMHIPPNGFSWEIGYNQEWESIHLRND